MAMREIVELADIVDEYDAFVLDQFGVLLGGDRAYSYAPSALRRLADLGKIILILSNSGKRAAANELRLTRYGFDPDSYHCVLSSGEVAYRTLSKRIGKSIDVGTKIFLLSRNGDTSCIDGLDIEQTNYMHDAGLLILAGNEGGTESLDDYAKLLMTSAQNNVPCLCTNPDMTMLTKQGLHFGNGRIAQLYEELGGHVEWIGKPYPLIYEMAKDILVEQGAKKILCVGDSPDHDIVGGKNARFATALVRTGIHADEPLRKVLDKCTQNNAMPDYILQKFYF